MQGRVIIINNENYGFIGVFLKKLLASLSKPDIIIFYDLAVKLLRTKSDTINILEALQASGVDLIACGMCDDGKCDTSPLLVGRITSMDEIVSVVMSAKIIITI